MTNGWDEGARQRAIAKFGLDHKEMDARHKLSFDTYELGKMSLDEYLDNVIFHRPREFSKDDFISFMLSQSQALDGSLEYFSELKKRYGFKIIAVSNEARDLNDFRIRKFELHNLFDAFISSCYIALRKPDASMYRMACDISQTAAEEALYVDDQLMYIEVACALGIPSLHYQSLEQAKKFMEELGYTLK